MATLEDLPPDQRAVLSLVLKQSKSYAEIATLLSLEESAVRDRAHAALDELGPRDGTPLPAPRRAALADFLLNQQPEDEAQQTRNYLASSAAGRGWTRVVADALRPLGGEALPEIPAERAAAPPEPAAPPPPRPAPAPVSAAAASPDATPARAAGTSGGRPPASRRGGALLLGAAAVAAVVVVLLLVLSGGSSKHHRASTGATGATGATGTPQIIGQVNMTSPGGGKKTIGIALIIAQGNQAALELQAQGLTPTTRSFGYGVWLYNSHSSAEAIGSAPAVKANGRLSALAALPNDTANFRALIITRETSSRPTQPGPIVLSGPLPGHTVGH